jgi:hypothetical protein
MSSWKQYGGINNFERFGQMNADTLTVNKFSLKDWYQGNFDICGQLNVVGDAIIYNSLYVKENVDICGNVTVGSSNSQFIINSDSIFNGPVLFNSSFDVDGNIHTQNNLLVEQNAYIGNSIFLNNGPFLYGNSFSLGINTRNPCAALDISTSLVRGLYVHSSNITNENILAQNNQSFGLSVGADVSSSHIYFYHDHSVLSGNTDGKISYFSGGYLNIDVSNNVNISCPTTISMTENNNHPYGEIFTIYDVSKSVYFGNIYQNPVAYTGPGAAIIADSNASNTFMNIGTIGGRGLGIAGGAYPVDTRSMATIGVTENGSYTPAQTIVSGRSSRYYTTTGVNTYKPRVDTFVLDINGPIHIDNGDIANSTGDIPFELYSIGVAQDNTNIVAALGSSIDVKVDNPPGSYVREKIIVTKNGGNSWSFIDISNQFGYPDSILKGNVLTSIDVYDSNNWFITGDKNSLMNTFNGGNTWQNINTGDVLVYSYDNIFINKTGKTVSGNVIGYYSKNNLLDRFEIPINTSFTGIVNVNSTVTPLSYISAISASSKTVYLSGNYIVKYTGGNIIGAPLTNLVTHSYLSYSYNDIKVYDNSFAIAVGGNVISSTVDGGVTWFDNSFNTVYPTGVNFTSVYITDASNAIAVGSQGNIWITRNNGIVWNPIPLNLINSSGKASWLLSSNLFQNVIVTDPNTIMITNTIQKYNYSANVYGRSSIFSIFSPNFINQTNNNVLDVSGTARFSGDVYINENGGLKSTNKTINIVNTGVENIFLGGEATAIVMGNSSVGNTIIKNSMNITNTTKSTSSTTGALVVNGGAGIGGDLNVGGNSYFSLIRNSGNLTVNGFSNFVLDSSFNGNVLITSSSGSSSSTTGALVIKGGIGMGGNLNVGGVSNFALDSSFNGNVLMTSSSGSSGSTSGALVIKGGVGVGGNLNVGGFSNFASDSVYSGNMAINANTVSYGSTTGALVIKGGVGVGGDLNVGTNSNFYGSVSVLSNSVTNITDGISIGGSMIVGGLSRFVLDSSFNGNVFISSSSGSFGSNTGALVIKGGVGVGGNLNVGGFSNFASDSSFNGNVLMTSSSGSFGSTTGALVIKGGVGVGGDLNVAGNSTVKKVTCDSVITANIACPGSAMYITSTSSSTGTTYYIGRDAQDTLIVNATFNQQSIVQTSSNAPTFVVNNRLGNAISAGSGIDIFDNSNSTIYTNHVFGYMRVGRDLQSYIFKAPSYGTWNGSAFDPTNNTLPIQLISPENRVRFSVNEMTLTNTSISRGLVILQSDSKYQQYQTSRGHNYGSYGDADYAMNICSDFDISNILLKNMDTVKGTQSIGTNLTVGNTVIPSTFSVYGNSVVFGNSFVYGNVDVQGSSRFVGSLVSTNYDTFLFSSQYGNTWVDNLNTVPDSSYYQDSAMSYDGKYQYALVYNKYGVGSVNKSADYGVTWSLTSLPANYTNNIIYQAVPYLSSNRTTFRFQDLAANISLPNAQPLNIQVGTYVAAASSTFFSSAYYVFDNSTSTEWISTSIYSPSNGSYTGSVFTTDLFTSTNIYGEYVQITLPYSFILRNYQHYPLVTTNYSKIIYTFGSNNTVDWYNLTPGGSIISNTGNTYVSISNNTAYSSYRFVVNATYSPGITQPYISRIDLSGIFQNPTGLYSSAIAASGTGQYVTITNQGYCSNTGNLYISNDYGSTFIDSGRNPYAFWQSVAISQTGQIQTAIEINRSGTGNIWMSSNYGSSWGVVPTMNKLNGWQTISMSSTGQYMTAVQSSSFSSPKGTIWISSDYGSTWNSTQQIYNYTQTVNGFLNLGTPDFNKTVCVSSSGQYQTVLSLAPSSDINGNATIWTSSDYGQNWVDSGYKAPSISGSVSILSSISMVSSGENQVISYIGGNTGLGVPTNTVYGNILTSSNYGSSWADVKFKVPTETIGGNTYYGYVTKVQSSLNGKYIFGVSKYQDVSSNFYNNTNNTVGGVGNLFVSQIPVSSQMFSTQYMGSSNIGGVLETHGLKMSVPLVNNAALLMGYDLIYDSCYMNSADLYGTNSLCLNTTGGFVGVGMMTPMYNLDISGTFGVAGQIVTRYGGSSNYGDVSQTHGFKLSVSFGGYNSLIMGVDAINNCSYMNSADIVGSKPLCLNTTGGLVSVGMITPSYNLDVSGTIRATGQITAMSFNATSDYRMKMNQREIASSMNIDLLRPIEYDLSGGSHDMGFLAHEVQEVFPFLVSGEKDGEEMQSLNYNGFIALLVKEVQELKMENKRLKERMVRIEVGNR